MNDNGRLTLPGQVNVQVAFHPTPAAHPSMMTLQQSGGVQLHIFGGLTKLEYAAIHLGSVERAQDILAECAKLEQT